MAGDFEPWREWSKLDIDGKLTKEACVDYYERFLREE
jgi:hypothetical protein